jgi:nitrogen fixation/metabolism regulation signal transduction histidine kinase
VASTGGGRTERAGFDQRADGVGGIRLRRTDDAIELTIDDNGTGLPERGLVAPGEDGHEELLRDP